MEGQAKPAQTKEEHLTVHNIYSCFVHFAISRLLLEYQYERKYSSLKEDNQAVPKQTTERRSVVCKMQPLTGCNFATTEPILENFSVVNSS